MKELFSKYQILIFRIIGISFVLIGFVMFFWTTPKKGISENELAALNVARMEAHVKGVSPSASKTPTSKPTKSPFLDKFKSTREAQIRYTLIMMMILGVGFLIYSFIKKDKD